MKTLKTPARIKIPGVSFANASDAAQIKRVAPGTKMRTFGNIIIPEFANSRLEVKGPDTSSGYRAGDVYFANSARFTEANYSEPLTNYLVGFKDPNNIEATLQFFAPAVTVPGRLFEFKNAVNSEEFLSEIVDDQRAIGADFKRVIYSGTDSTAKTINRGLTMIVDLDDVGVGGSEADVPPWQAQKVAKLTRRLYRNSLRRALTAISAAAVTIPYTWDKSAGVNPDINVGQELINATNISGIRPNRVAYGDTAFLLRNQAYGAQNNPAGYIGYNQGAPEGSMAAALQVDRVLISRERYQSSDAAKSEILGPNVYAFFAMDDVDTEDPSNIKRFVSTFSEEQGGGLFRVFVEQIGAKLVAITIEFYEIIVITYSGGIRQLQITGPA